MANQTLLIYYIIAHEQSTFRIMQLEKYMNLYCYEVLYEMSASIVLVGLFLRGPQPMICNENPVTGSLSSVQRSAQQH